MYITCKFRNSCRFVNIDVDEITIKPSNLNHLEAASLPYAALTTWSALIRWLDFVPMIQKEKKYLYKAVQVALDVFQYNYLKTLVVEVATTCSERNINLVKSLEQIT